ncbi:SIR2 family protein [uncultured Williamsia sp.]|uniref:SIR2 family protein n=1 Tax=uncultured Williamsia sp. TaxID=259311 RepID=UPI002613B1A8|nr:SIR2 family protein [uncultured Williamsia sp.]
MDDRSLDDALLPLALAVHASPGGYAVLAGAGVSVGAGLPSAWGVLTALADQVRVVEDPDAPPLAGDTVEAWWRERFCDDVSYSGVFARLSNTKVEREALLREHIETGDGPGQAHRAIARLVQLGVIQIIVTLNFDRLFETALRELGIEPRVISTVAAADSARPLHDGGAVVVHLHGDYLDADSMLNTEQELGSYADAMHRLISRIVADHGLLIAGWSADHDTALRDIVTREHRGYYRAAWITPHKPSDTGRDVINQLDAHHFAATADELFGRLADAVTTLRRRHGTRHPLTAAVAVDRIKRDLTGEHPAITAHDTATAALARLDDLPVMSLAVASKATTEQYPDHVADIAAACEVPAAAIAALAYWGNPVTDDWWLPTIEHWARTLNMSGLTAYVELPLTVATRLYYAAGVAATAAHRYDLLAKLLSVRTVQHRRRSTPACRLLNWCRMDYPSVHAPTRLDLETTIREALTLSADRVSAAWQEFELLQMTAAICTGPEFTDTNIQDYQDAAQHLSSFPDEASPERAQAWRDVDSKRGSFARTATNYHPRVEMVDSWERLGSERWVSPAALRLNTQTSALAPFRSLCPQISEQSRQYAVEVAVEASHAFVQMETNRRFFMTNADAVWLDDKTDTNG